MSAPYRIRRGDAGLWLIEKRDGDTYGLATFTFERAIAEVCRLEAYRIAGCDFDLRRYVDGRGAWMIAAIPATGGVGVSFPTWEQVALYLCGVREREEWQTLRRLERSLGLPLTAFPGLPS